MTATGPGFFTAVTLGLLPEVHKGRANARKNVWHLRPVQRLD
jgi:hypothetical protein